MANVTATGGDASGMLLTSQHETLTAMLQSTQCPVCWNQYSNSPSGQARCLLCSHLVCTGCLTRLTQRDVVSCPICRDEIDTDQHPPPIVREVGFLAEQLRLMQQPLQPDDSQADYGPSQPPAPTHLQEHPSRVRVQQDPRPQQQQSQARPPQIDWESQSAEDTRELDQGMWDFDDSMIVEGQNRQTVQEPDEYWEEVRADDLSGRDIEEIIRALNEEETGSVLNTDRRFMSSSDLLDFMSDYDYDVAGGFIRSPDNSMDRGFMRSTSSSSVGSSSDLDEAGRYVPNPDGRSMAVRSISSLDISMRSDRADVGTSMRWLSTESLASSLSSGSILAHLATVGYNPNSDSPMADSLRAEPRSTSSISDLSGAEGGYTISPYRSLADSPVRSDRANSAHSTRRSLSEVSVLSAVGGHVRSVAGGTRTTAGRRIRAGPMAFDSPNVSSSSSSFS